MKRLAGLLLLLFLAIPAMAQVANKGDTVQNAATGNANGKNVFTDGYTLITYQVSGTFTATVNPEASLDGITFNSLTCYDLTGLNTVTAITTSGTYRCNLSGHNVARARISGYSGGSVTVNISVMAGGSASGGSSAVSVLRACNQPGVVVVTCPPYNVKGDGSTDDGTAITNALASITSGTIYFPYTSGGYAYATSPNFCKTNITIEMSIGGKFIHTGSGNAFVCDGGAGAATNGMNVHLKNITVSGNSNSTNGFYFRNIHHSKFENLRVLGAATTGSAFRMDYGVLNTWINPRATVNETGGLSPVPLYGILLTRRAPGDNTTTQTIINPIMEGFSTASASGIYVDWANNNNFIGGTSESNINGITITGNGYGNNYFEGIDLEANTTSDITITGGVYNTFVGLLSLGTVTLNGGYNNFLGGTLTTLNVGNFFYNKISKLLITTAYTDTSASTIWENVIGPGGTPITNQVVAQVKSTLPTGTAPFSVASTTPVPNLNSYLTTYNSGGTQQINTHGVFGTCIASGGTCSITLSGSAIFTSSSSYGCTATDTSQQFATRVNQTSGSAFTLYASGSDVIQYNCLGN